MRADACDACLEVGSLAARQAQGSVPRQQCLTAAHAHAGHTVKLALLLKARVLAIPSKQVAAETCLLGISVISSSSSVPDWKALVAETRRRGRPGRPPDFDAADWSDMPSIAAAGSGARPGRLQRMPMQQTMLPTAAAENRRLKTRALPTQSSHMLSEPFVRAAQGRVGVAIARTCCRDSGGMLRDCSHQPCRARAAAVIMQLLQTQACPGCGLHKLAHCLTLLTCAAGTTRSELLTHAVGACRPRRWLRRPGANARRSGNDPN